jgi:hypothetical protein
VFSNYGYEPKGGILIQNTGSGPVLVTGSQNRVYYVRPTVDAPSNSKYDTFNYIVVRNDGVTSLPGTVTLVSPGGGIMSSDFFFDSEGWIITGNTAGDGTGITIPSHEPYLLGNTLSRYILGSDAVINTGTGYSPSQSRGTDSMLWYFEAPDKFLGNLGIAYNGYFSFAIQSFAGDFSISNYNDLSATNLVELYCDDCRGPVRRGLKLVFPLKSLVTKSSTGLFLGNAMVVRIALQESSGWFVDPQDVLQRGHEKTPTQCQMIQTLSRLSKIRILGDFTQLSETVALDDVRITNSKESLPVCAMYRPDASVCHC